MLQRFLMALGVMLIAVQGMAQVNTADVANASDATGTATEMPVMVPGMTNEQFMKMLKHTSPMPNLMMTVLQNKEALGLDEIQIRNLEFWRDHKSLPAKKLVKEIVELEKEINAATLAGKPTGYLIKQISTMLSKRMQLASQKVLCRDNMMHVLTPEQWSRVVSMYKEKS